MRKKMCRLFLSFFSVIITLLLAHEILIAEETSGTEVNFKKMPTHERRAHFAKIWQALEKASQEDPRHDKTKETIIEGNQIRVLLTNQGSISTPNADEANADLVWPRGPDGLGYAYEFAPLVAAEVIGGEGDTLHIVDDGFLSASDGDFQPGTVNRWGREPR
jgi:hypothetical protein